MTHCVDFWHKWRKEPNFCGLSPQSISEIKGYLELVEKIKSTGIDEEIIFEKCPSGACRPLLRISDDETRTKGLNYLVASLKRGEKVTQSDLQSSINGWLKKEEACKLPESTHLRRVEQPEPPVEKPVNPSNSTGLDLSDLPQLSPDADISERLKRDYIMLERAGFTRASDLLAATPIKPAPLIIVPVPVSKEQAEYKITEVVRGYLSPKSKETWELIRKSGEFGDQNLEIFQGMIDRYGELLGGE